MNKKLLELLNSINQKKVEIKNLVDAGKIEEAKTAKQELINMQDQFDILKDIEDSAVPTPAPANLNPIKPVVDETEEHKFANAARMGFKNATMTEGSKVDGGYTVPEDVKTKVETYRDATMHLGQFVTVETVTTATGARTYQTKAKNAGFSKVAEGGRAGAIASPQFERLSYAVEKYSGVLPCTNELLADSDANINNTIAKWLGDASRVTRNKEIVAALTEAKTEEGYKVIDSLDDITSILNIDLGSTYKGTSKIFTNDFGLQQLHLFKDANGRSLLQPNPVEPTKMQIAAGASVVEVITVPTNDLPNVTVEEKEYAPLIIGDLKESVIIFDRQKLTVSSSNIAVAGDLNAFTDDLTIFKGTERLDVKVKDEDAYVLGYFATAIETPVAVG